MRFQAQPKRNRSRTRAAGVLFRAIILPALVALASYSSQARAELKGSKAFHQEIATHFAFDSNKASQKELDASFADIDHLVARMKADKAQIEAQLRQFGAIVFVWNRFASGWE